MPSNSRKNLLLGCLLTLSLLATPIAHASSAVDLNTTETPSIEHPQQATLWDLIVDFVQSIWNGEPEEVSLESSEAPTGEPEYGPGLDPFG